MHGKTILLVSDGDSVTHSIVLRRVDLELPTYRLVFAVNQNFFGNGKPFLEIIIIRFYSRTFGIVAKGTIASGNDSEFFIELLSVGKDFA